jgi:hypothetical protein
MSSFLNCNIWSINDCIMSEDGYTVVRRVYEYNSDTDDFNTPIPPGFIQIPEFEIKNLHLLNNLNYDFINEFKIPIIKKQTDGSWSVDLKYYNDTYLQSTNSPPTN